MLFNLIQILTQGLAFWKSFATNHYKPRWWANDNIVQEKKVRII